MRQAADILSSAPAMQIRYLEAMQAMAKSANSKVIFLPAVNQTMTGSSAFNAAPVNANHHEDGDSGPGSFGDFGGQDLSFQHAINAQLVQNI